MWDLSELSSSFLSSEIEIRRHWSDARSAEHKKVSDDEDNVVHAVQMKQKRKLKEKKLL